MSWTEIGESFGSATEPGVPGRKEESSVCRGHGGSAAKRMVRVRLTGGTIDALHHPALEVQPDLHMWEEPCGKTQSQWRYLIDMPNSESEGPFISRKYFCWIAGLEPDSGVQERRLVLTTSSAEELPHPHLWKGWFCPRCGNPKQGIIALGRKSVPLLAHELGHLAWSETGPRPPLSRSLP